MAAAAVPPHDTRAQRKARVWEHVRDEILEATVGTPLRSHLDRERIDDVTTLISYTDDDIANMQYDDAGTLEDVPRGTKCKIRILEAFFYDRCFRENRIVEWTELTGDEFDEYKLGPYNPRAPIIPFGGSAPNQALLDFNVSARRLEATEAQRDASAASAAASHASLANNSKAASFKKGVKKTVDDYVIFKNKSIGIHGGEDSKPRSYNKVSTISLTMPTRPQLSEVTIWIFIIRSRNGCTPPSKRNFKQT